jgi:hypothetical protein
VGVKYASDSEFYYNIVFATGLYVCKTGQAKLLCGICVCNTVMLTTGGRIDVNRCPDGHIVNSLFRATIQWSCETMCSTWITDGVDLCGCWPTVITQSKPVGSSTKHFQSKPVGSSTKHFKSKRVGSSTQLKEKYLTGSSTSNPFIEKLNLCQVLN